MDKDFWLEKWESQVLGFHLDQPNALLLNHIGCLSLAEGSRIFVPLCGKTLDIGWLLQQGYSIAGCELSERAVVELFQQLELDAIVTPLAEGYLFSARNIDIFVHDIFELSADMLGSIDAVYDRAALIALPAVMRERYAAHLLALTHSAPQLVVTLVYDQSELPGPPFSVSDGNVQKIYADHYELEMLMSNEVVGGLKGKCPAIENVWLLSLPDLEQSGLE